MTAPGNDFIEEEVDFVPNDDLNIRSAEKPAYELNVKGPESLYLLTQPTREKSEQVLQYLAEDLKHIYGVSTIKNVYVPEDDSLEKIDKGLEKLYDRFREDYGIVDESPIVTTKSFIDTGRLISMFVTGENVPVMIIQDKGGLRNDEFIIDFFSDPNTTRKDVVEWYRRWSRDIRYS